MSEVNKEEEESLAPVELEKMLLHQSAMLSSMLRRLDSNLLVFFTESDQKLFDLRSEANIEEYSIIWFHNEALFLS